MRGTVTFLGLLLTLSNTAIYAHQDTIIRLENDGSLIGLPSEYNPAKMMVRFPEFAVASLSVLAVDLQIGDNRISLPSCVTEIVRARGLDDIGITASWYHHEDILPHYMRVIFTDPDDTRTLWDRKGLRLLFNLHTAKLLKIPYVVSANCRPEVIDAIAEENATVE
jgi:hypothetical protein